MHVCVKEVVGLGYGKVGCGLGVVAGGLGVAQSSPGQSVGSGHLGSRHTAHCPSFQLFTRYIIISEIPSEMEVALCYFICAAYTAFTAQTVFEQKSFHAYTVFLYGFMGFGTKRGIG